MKEIYQVKELCSGLYGIKEQYGAQGGVMMYLVVGQEKAALIDSGFGVVDTLRALVEQITDKPVICLVAHGHPDHVGAAALFDEIYMNQRDEELLPVSLSYDRRMGDVFGHYEDEELRAYCDSHIVMPEKLNYKNIDHGAKIDLGGTVLEAFALPGHTQGSLAFYNEKENYALTSDGFSHRTALVTLPPEKRVGIQAYRDGLSRFLEAINEDTLLYWGHSDQPMPHELPQDMLRACNEVLDGQTQQDVVSSSHFARRASASGKKMCEHTCGSVLLVYDANTL